jgi:hypothetical protein
MLTYADGSERAHTLWRQCSAKACWRSTKASATPKHSAKKKNAAAGVAAALKSMDTNLRAKLKK